MVELLAETQLIKERESFSDRLNNLTPKDKAMVMLAYMEAEKAHNGEIRDSGERFFEHPLQATHISLDSGIKNPVVLASILTHDVLENTRYFVDLEVFTYEEGRAVAREKITNLFGAEVAETVIPLTKPKGKDLVDLSHEELVKIYRQQFVDVSVKSLLVKMADKLHNLRKVYSCSLKRQQGQVEETEDFYMPLFKKVLVEYPKEGAYLIDQINFEISKWKANNIKN